MLRSTLVLFFLSGTWGCGAGPDTTPRGDAGTRGDAGVSDTRDEDGDSISDSHEGRREMRDTDGDGTLDFQDGDSDNDGVRDADEAGDTILASPPRDTDGDGDADAYDLDSDGNGIPDAMEGDGDLDGDGVPDRTDLDDDGDFVQDGVELAGRIDPPIDADADGQPNYHDPDSDNDTILDGHEHGVDTDGDMLPDHEDTDTDGDGSPDADEAGDADPATLPVDTDMDGDEDFRDTDSDDDGLSDSDELMAGSSRTLGDTDMDGVSDLIEFAAGTDAINPMDSPRTRGDFVFVVPYMMPPEPERDTLHFRTHIQFADVYFLFDISGSMGGEIMALRDAVGTLITDLTCTDSGTACTRDAECGAGEICSPFTSTCIEDPGASSCILSAFTGTGYYEATYVNGLSLQADPMMTRTAIRTATFGGTEELNEALLGMANPAMVDGETGCTGPGAGTIGCPAFRSTAVRIAVAFTDEDSDGAVTAVQAGTALRDAGITVIGVWSGTAGATTRAELVDVVRESGSLDTAGVPLVFDGMDGTVVPAVTGAINEIVEGIPLRVTIAATDEPGDAGDALQFVDHLEINTTAMDCTAAEPREDTNADGFEDAFPALRPGTPVCWDVVARRNDVVMPDRVPLIFRARVTVSGDGSPLDSRIVYFLIPPRIDPPGGPD
jgi:hypothetical protein